MSRTAASFVLTGRREEMRISADAEDRVLRAAREMGYRPNIVSRSLRTGTTHTLGFISDTVATTPFAGDLIKGALEAARDRDHLLLIAETEGDPKLEQELLEAMVDRQVDGIVLASMYTRRVAVPKLLKSRAAVLLNAIPTRPASLISVIPDELGGRTNRRRDADQGRSPRRDLSDRRGPAPKPRAKAGGGPRRRSNASKASSRRSARPALQSRRGRRVRRVATRARIRRRSQADRRAARTLRALICFNDRLALGAYNALADAGLAVPSDVSVVSFDDDPIASWLQPQLTTIAIPHYELGRKSIELLLDGPRGLTPSGQTVFRIPMPLRFRESVGPTA